MLQAAGQNSRQALHGLGEVVANLWRRQPSLMLFGLLMAMFTVFFAVGIFADSRVITGAPAWLKPTKFGISISIYTFTLTWLLSLLRPRRAWLRRAIPVISWTVIATFVAEMLAIVTQVVRGTTSHFNVATPFDAVVYSVMSMAIVVLWSANFVLAAILLAERFENRALGWSLRLAVIITIIGMGLGFLMTSPTAQQMASWQTGEAVTIVGAHSVGVADGGAGLPLVDWSTEGGDLRVPHFVGMHALQVIALVGLLASRRRRWTEEQQVRVVWIAAAAFTGVLGLVTWQALRGQSVVAPDALTLSAAALIAVATVIALMVTFRKPRSLDPAR